MNLICFGHEDYVGANDREVEMYIRQLKSMRF